MKQVAQNFNTGEIRVLDVPVPALQPGCVLVRVEASLLSAGTEKSKVDLGRKSLVGKAQARPDLVAQVLSKVKTEGIAATVQTVRNRLDSWSPLGYSCAGVVERVAPGVSSFRIGDRVACAGAESAVHAGYVCVPELLCSKMPDEVSFEDAAYTTVGCVAMNGIRQSGVSYGERVLVIGLGLIGRITVQLLQASGCRVAGTDVSAAAVEGARAGGCDLTTAADAPGVEGLLMAFTEGMGFDAVIITAGAPDNSPFVLAGAVARDRARVVLVGATPMEVPRSPYYEKELSVVLSRSYGPGRYDASYEVHGHDYPAGYVRWTEGRNMAAFLGALARGDVNAAALTTHRFAVEEAPDAYDLLATGREPYLGIVLAYSEDPLPEADTTAGTQVTPARGDGVAFVGAGNFATRVLLPAVRAAGVPLDTVISARGLSAVDAAAKFGFAHAESDAAKAFARPEVGLAFISTRHDSHAALTMSALRAGLAVFVEKPLCLRSDDLPGLLEAQREHRAVCMVGFNRRFAPMTRQALEVRDRTKGPVQCLIRVNAGAIPPDSWIQDPQVGGGRIIGEVCHFIDLAICLTGSPAASVTARAIGNGKSPELQDSLSVIVMHADGSLSSVVYAADGDTAIPKERIELFGGASTVAIDDFRELRIASGGRVKGSKGAQDKGHRTEVTSFVDAAKAGREPSELTFAECVHSTIATFAAVESLRSESTIDIAVYTAEITGS
ncbi:MAG: bi-domain-containing oxidoreductase [Coriobacteriia bacterium]|nr:bi-domain-containing oxidoreductase [Coriobacteriia bacterium]